MRTKLHNVGRYGIIDDLSAHDCPPEAWTAGRNIRCYNGSIYRCFGDVGIFGVPLGRPLGIFPIAAGSNFFYAYPSTNKAYATDGTLHGDITRISGDYTGDDDDRWNGVNLGSLMILNNGKDVPQQWIGPSLAVPLEDLDNWPATHIARVVRNYKAYLIALVTTEDGTTYPHRVRWSHRAAAGAVPSTWVPDAGNDAGFWDLLESDGPCVDCKELGDVNYVYKEDSTHSMEYIGGQFIFKFRRKFGFGALAQDCIREYEKKSHIVGTFDDVVLHDGFQAKSLLDERRRLWYRTRVDTTYYKRSFLAFNEADSDLYFCFPETGSTWPNLALIINTKTGTITERDIPNPSGWMYSFPASTGAGTTWDSVALSWDQMVGNWGDVNFNAGRKRLVFSSPDRSRNELQRSNDFSHAYWTSNQISWEANVASNPLTGANDVDKMRATAVSAQHYFHRTISKAATGEDWTASVYVQPGEYTDAYLRLDDGVGNGYIAKFSLVGAGVLVATTIISVGFTLRGAQIEQLGTGYRLHLSVTTNNSVNLRAVFYLDDGTGTASTPATFVGNGVNGLYPSDFQMRKGLHAGVYQDTTTLEARNAFFLIEQSFDFDGKPFPAYVERRALAVFGQDREGQPKVDFEINKLIAELWPKMRVSNGSTINISVGGQATVDSALTVVGPFPFQPGIDMAVYPSIEGRLNFVRFETTDRTYWKLDGYDLEMHNLGKY